jgi:hypothetical protein
MIIVRLMGGLGNQMFQYAFGRSLSIKYNVPLKIDLSFLKNKNQGPNFIYRDYDLDVFKIDPDMVDLNIDTIENFHTVNEINFHYSEREVSEISDFLKRNIPVLICGHWQSPFYFMDSADTIRKDFCFKNEVEKTSDDSVLSILEKIKKTNSVAINIRRTDYLNTSYHGVFGTEYVNHAKRIIESSIVDPHYFIFSDDVEWCRENIAFDNSTLVDHSYKGEKFSYYLQLMKNCKNFIIPNSSFAWWSSWLNDDQSKIVVCPKKWFTNSSINTSDLIPSDWIRI